MSAERAAQPADNVEFIDLVVALGRVSSDLGMEPSVIDAFREGDPAVREAARQEVLGGLLMTDADVRVYDYLQSGTS
jgi:hypothetical protein